MAVSQLLGAGSPVTAAYRRGFSTRHSRHQQSEEGPSRSSKRGGLIPGDGVTPMLAFEERPPVALANAQCPGQTGLPAQGAGCRNSTHIVCDRDTPAAGLRPLPAATASQPHRARLQTVGYTPTPPPGRPASIPISEHSLHPAGNARPLQVNARRPSCFQERMHLAEVNKGLG